MSRLFGWSCGNFYQTKFVIFNEPNLLTVERTAEAIIFRVPATLDDEAVKNIEKYISKMEAPVDKAEAYDPDLPFGEGFDKDGFVIDPVVLEIAQKVNHAGMMKVKERFKDNPEFMALLNDEEE